MMLLCIFVSIFCGYTTAQEQGHIVGVIFDEDHSDGSITLRCQTYFTGSASEIDHSWIHNGKLLTKNTELLEVNSSRYSVGYLNNDGIVYKLTIMNPVQMDQGNYQCVIEYTSYQKLCSDSRDVDVNINSYLPPLKYPSCSIRPSQTLTNGNFAEFKCDIGETTTQITLNLTLQSYGGFVTYLGFATVTRRVTVQNNNALFICQMSSKTFPTAYRKCSAGPLKILEEDSNTKHMSTQFLKSTTRISTTRPTTDLTTKAPQTIQNLVPTIPLTYT